MQLLVAAVAVSVGLLADGLVNPETGAFVQPGVQVSVQPADHFALEGYAAALDHSGFFEAGGRAYFLRPTMRVRPFAGARVGMTYYRDEFESVRGPVVTGAMGLEAELHPNLLVLADAGVSAVKIGDTDVPAPLVRGRLGLLYRF